MFKSQLGEFDLFPNCHIVFHGVQLLYYTMKCYWNAMNILILVIGFPSKSFPWALFRATMIILAVPGWPRTGPRTGMSPDVFFWKKNEITVIKPYKTMVSQHGNHGIFSCFHNFPSIFVRWRSWICWRDLKSIKQIRNSPSRFPKWWINQWKSKRSECFPVGN